MGLKLIGMIMIIMTTSLIGTGLSGSLSERAARLNVIDLMFDRIATLIKFRCMPTGEILRELSGDCSFSALTFLHNSLQYYESGDSFPRAWQKGVEADSSLKNDEKIILLSAGRSLGTSDCDGQLSMIEVFRQNINHLSDSAREESLKKGRLYRSLGVLAGVFISVMLV